MALVFAAAMKQPSVRLCCRVLYATLACVAFAGCASDEGNLPRSIADAAADAVADGPNPADAGDSGSAAGNADTSDAMIRDALADALMPADALVADSAPICTPKGDCSPFVANSCGSGKTCRAETAGTMCGLIPAQPLGEGLSCVATYECDAGLVCLNLQGAGARCHLLCPANASGYCGTGKACSVEIAGQSCLKLCTPLAAACDIYDAQSCAGANMKCDLARHPETDVRYTACLAAGSGKTGDACAGGSQCGRGLVCINSGTGAKCRQVCDAQDGVPGCASVGETCAGRSTSYGVTFCL